MFFQAATVGVLWKSFLKNFAILTRKHLSCESLFYKVTGLQPSGLHHRCFLVNNAKFLATSILKNICEPLPLLFQVNSLNGLEKTILKTKWQKLINKYKNTFICTLHAAMKTNHWNLYNRHTQSNSFRVLTLTSDKLTDMKCTPKRISYHF